MAAFLIKKWPRAIHLKVTLYYITSELRVRNYSSGLRKGAGPLSREQRRSRGEQEGVAGSKEEQRGAAREH